jgi:flavin reductase (DIM6/NTAB) family NADH-FMN oxidoreductase RutF
MKSLRLSELSVRDTYQLLISSIVPRPIAFVSTVSKTGVTNVAPFSFFSGVSSKPPCLSIAIARKPDGSLKDTLANIRGSGEFVVNTANEWLFDQMVDSAAPYPSETSEFEAIGLTPLASTMIKAPRVKESSLQLECILHKEVEIGDGSAGSSTLVIGEILVVHMKEDLATERGVDIDGLKPISRLGGSDYATIGEKKKKRVPAI